MVHEVERHLHVLSRSSSSSPCAPMKKLKRLDKIKKLRDSRKGQRRSARPVTPEAGTDPGPAAVRKQGQGGTPATSFPRIGADIRG